MAGSKYINITMGMKLDTLPPLAQNSCWSVPRVSIQWLKPDLVTFHISSDVLISLCPDSLTFFQFPSHIRLSKFRYDYCQILHCPLKTSELVLLSEAMLPVVRPGIVTAFPFTSCRGEKPSLLMDVLCVQAVALISESYNRAFLSSISLRIVISPVAWFLSFIPLLHGEYAGLNFTVKPKLLVNS